LAASPHIHRGAFMLPGIKQFDLSGRSAIITGGSRGLGEAMAAGLASAGADVLVTSRHAEEAAATAAKLAKDYGRKAIGMQADVTSQMDVKEMVERALSELGGLDILINNAGINIRGPIDELTPEQFKEVHDINVDGLWL